MFCNPRMMILLDRRTPYLGKYARESRIKENNNTNGEQQIDSLANQEEIEDDKEPEGEPITEFNETEANANKEVNVEQVEIQVQSNKEDEVPIIPLEEINEGKDNDEIPLDDVPKPTNQSKKKNVS